MIGLAFGETAVHEIKITAKRATCAAGKRRNRSAAKVRGGPGNGSYRLGIDGADGDANRIQHTDLDLLHCLVAEILEIV
jgi:hypothetical protein